MIHNSRLLTETERRRRSLGLSQAALGQLIGRTQAWVSMQERRDHPSLLLMRALTVLERQGPRETR
jgi:hypothetical protein